MNLYDFPVQCRPCKMVGAAFMKEQMKHDPIKCRVLRVTVAVPICDVHIQFDISLQQLFSVDSERCMNEIGAGLAIPESELDNLNQGTGNGTESGPERAGVPHGLPFEFGPFFGEIADGLSQKRRDLAAGLLIERLIGRTVGFMLHLF